MREEVLIDKVVCSDCFCVSVCEKEIEIKGPKIPPGSRICGDTEIAVLECVPVLDHEKESLRFRFVFFIHKELTVITPCGRKIPVEIGYRVKKEVCGTCCSLCDVWKLDPCLLPRLECRILDMSFADYVTLRPSAPCRPASFEDRLSIEIRLSLVVPQQEALPSPQCPSLPFPLFNR